jgi:hypothetical protein
VHSEHKQLSLRTDQVMAKYTFHLQLTLALLPTALRPVSGNSVTCFLGKWKLDPASLTRCLTR